jgi:hypothetical protein
MVFPQPAQAAMAEEDWKTEPPAEVVALAPPEQGLPMPAQAEESLPEP